MHNIEVHETIKTNVGRGVNITCCCHVEYRVESIRVIMESIRGNYRFEISNNVNGEVRDMNPYESWCELIRCKKCIISEIMKA